METNIHYNGIRPEESHTGVNRTIENVPIVFTTELLADGPELYQVLQDLLELIPEDSELAKGYAYDRAQKLIEKHK